MTILVGYIPSPQGDAALDRAIEEARARGEDLVVLNASRGEAVVDPRFLYDSQEAEIRQRLDAAGVQYVIRREVENVEPAEELLAVVEELQPRLLVIGLRRRTAAGKFLFGSTAQRILLDADVDVLAVKVPRD